jgi:hypothetical protein
MMGKVRRIFTFAFIFSAIFFGQALAQTREPDAQPLEPPKLFLNCTDNCYQDYVKTELSLFEFVRDQAQADIQILIISKEHAGGGNLYTLTFIGQNTFATITDTLTFATKQAQSESMIRDELVKQLKYGLVRYVARTSLVDQIQVNFNKRKQQETMIEDEGWNYWVFTLKVDASFNGESNKRSTSIDNSFDAKRITAKSRSGVSGYYNYNQNKFTLDSNQISVSYVSFGLDARYVKSLTEHWSSGVIYSLYHSVYANTKVSHRLAPVVEYNLFPYSENIRKQFRFAYQLGYYQISFLEQTVEERLKQSIAFHKFSIVADFTQTWGNVNTAFHAASFLNDFSRHRLSLDSQLNIRLAEGLSLSLSGSASLIKDQISLAKASADQSAVLLQGRQLPTSFSYSTYIGLSYTFGSINNSIVNVRLNQIE